MSKDNYFGRTSFVSFGTSYGRPLDVHMGHHLICLGCSQDVYAASFFPLGQQNVQKIMFKLKNKENIPALVLFISLINKNPKRCHKIAMEGLLICASRSKYLNSTDFEKI